MDFKQFTEGACGQSNPTEELASHVTRDNTHQDTINLPVPTSSETSTVPQIFRLTELMEEINKMESQNVASTDSWAAEHRNQLDQSTAYETIQPAQEATSQHRDHEQNYAYPSSSTCDRNRMLDLEMVNVNEELDKCKKLVKGAEKSQENVLESDDVIVQPQESSTEPNEKIKLLFFKEISAEDVHNADTQDVAWRNGESFVRFLTNYIKTFQRRDFDLNAETEYKFSKSNPYEGSVDETHARGLRHYEKHRPLHAILYFEAAVTVNQNDSEAWKYLVEVLMFNEQFYDAFCVAKKNLHQNLNYFSMIMYNFLFDEQHYYQGGQAILNWLKSHPDYHDVIPPNYVMEDKATTLIEKKEVADLQRMLIKAAHRKPDYYVSIALSRLYEISRSYEKSNYYILAAIKIKTKYQWKNLINLLYNLIRDDQANQALAVLDNLNRKKTNYSFRINCQNVSGIVYMFLENYEKACQHLLATLDKLIVWKTSEVCDLQKNTVWSELRLCFELMNRKDLLHIVEELNFKKLCEEFNYKPIV